MKFQITRSDISYNDIKEKLAIRFPEYSTKMRGKSFLVLKKTNTCGANIIIHKGKITVGGNFPTMGGTIIFSLLMVLLGILIPLIIYFITFHKKFKALENEIGDFLKSEYGEQEEEVL